MARARNIKPGFFKNEILAQGSPYSRLLFAGLWCIADREGRIEDRPVRIKTDTLPYDEVDMDDLLNELAGLGFIIRYTVGDARVIQILNFTKHQSPHKDELCLKLPSPESEGVCIIAQKSPELSRNSTLSPSSLNPSSLNDIPLESCSEHCHASEQIDQGEPPLSQTIIAFPTVGTKGNEWALTQLKLDEYSQAFPGINVHSECLKALQWCRDNPKKRKTVDGMPRFLGSWLGRAQDNAAKNSPARSPPVKQALSESERQQQARITLGLSQ